MSKVDYQALREQMVEYQIAARGVRDSKVLDAMRSVPREAFVPPELAGYAYEDGPLPIGQGQTISQPYIVALMCEALHLSPEDRVLDIGTGSGYAAAVLSRIVAEVYTVERHESLLDTAMEQFRVLGYRNIHSRHGDGTQGWPEQAPFAGIMVAAAASRVPPALREQLSIGGRLVIPLERHFHRQQLICEIRRDQERFEQEDLGGVRFVPLVSD